MSDVIDEEETNNDNWEEGDVTPTNIDKSPFKGKNKFLEAISRDENDSTTVKTDLKVSKALDSIKESFPNINKETLEKLSTVEGIKNREEIINSIPDNELLPVNQIVMKTLNDFSGKDKERIDEIINTTKKLDSTEVITLIKQEFPNYDDSSYKESFINAMEEEIASGKTELERKIISNDILNADLSEIENIKDKSDLRALKNAINENYTVGSIMNEIKSKTSSIFRSTSSNTELEPLTELINKGKGLQTLEDFKDEDKFTLKTESLKLKPDALIEKFKDLSNYSSDGYVQDLITLNIDQTIKNMANENPGSKQKVIERLIQENPLYKDEILTIVTQSLDGQFSYWESKLDDKKIEKMKKILLKEDLADLHSLGPDKTIDQIKTVSSINKTHGELLREVKNKASKSTINVDHYEETMNFFD
jgi:hypothetical protein